MVSKSGFEPLAQALQASVLPIIRLGHMQDRGIEPLTPPPIGGMIPLHQSHCSLRDYIE